MKNVILSTVIGVAMVVAGSAAADSAFKLGATQLDAVSGGSNTAEAGGNAGVSHGYYGREVYSNAYASGDRSRAYSSQLAVCAGANCIIAASSGSKAASRGRSYRRY